MNNNNNDDGHLRQRRRHRMFQQMQEQKRDDDEYQDNLRTWKKTHHDAYSDLFRTYIKTAGLLVFILIIMIAYLKPNLLYGWLFRHNSKSEEQQRLPTRTFITIYPRDVNIQEKLPKFFLGYAISKPDNLNERLAVQQFAQQKRYVTDHRQQKIRYAGWEFVDFENQLIHKQPGAMDYFCGSGYQTLYEQAMAMADNDNAGFAVSLVWSCLFKVGAADGYIDYNLKFRNSPISRGTRGVAAVRWFHHDQEDHSRIHSSSILLLPILNNEQRRKQKQQNQKDDESRKSDVTVSPSTVLPVEVVKYLLATGSSSSGKTTTDDNALFLEKFERMLYKVISKERSSWDIWNAACNKNDRINLQRTQRLMATTCAHGNEDVEDNDDDHCCSFYDPNLEPLSLLMMLDHRRDEDDDDDD